MEKEKKYKVLVVEDDDFLSEMYSLKLNMEGFDVKVGHDGDEGLKLAKKFLPDIILLDLLMPKKNGYEVLGDLKKSERLKHIPVIILSNLGQKEEVKKGMDLGAETFLTKAHYMPSEVISMVREILTKEQAKTK